MHLQEETLALLGPPLLSVVLIGICSIATTDRKNQWTELCLILSSIQFLVVPLENTQFYKRKKEKKIQSNGKVNFPHKEEIIVFKLI